MKPQPDVVIFMTDGATQSSVSDARKISAQARRKNITINAIALKEPKAREGMIILAEETGRTATMVESEKSIIDLITNEPLK